MSNELFRELVAGGVKKTLTMWRQLGFKPKKGEAYELGNSSNGFTWSHLYRADQVQRFQRRA